MRVLLFKFSNRKVLGNPFNFRVASLHNPFIWILRFRLLSNVARRSSLSLLFLKETRNSLKKWPLNLWWISNKTIMEARNITKAATFESSLHRSYKNSQLLFFVTVLFNISMSQTLNNDFWGSHKNMNCAFPLRVITLYSKTPSNVCLKTIQITMVLAFRFLWIKYHLVEFEPIFNLAKFWKLFLKHWHIIVIFIKRI